MLESRQQQQQCQQQLSTVGSDSQGCPEKATTAMIVQLPRKQQFRQFGSCATELLEISTVQLVLVQYLAPASGVV
jgi:hypothetical protein